MNVVNNKLYIYIIIIIYKRLVCRLVCRLDFTERPSNLDG